MLRVGLTGGIACGKSHVLRRLAGHGCHTLDLDRVARDLTAAGGPALAEIARAFGPTFLGPDGSLDRARLAAVVFSDAALRTRLNGIVHPRVRAAEAAWAASFVDRLGAVLVTDAALLIEGGRHLRFDRLIVAHCAPQLQLARLRERDGLDERAARARIEAQLPSAEKRAFAHFEIDSSGSPEETDRATDAVKAALSALAGAAREPVVPLERLVGGLAYGPQEGPRGLSPALLLSEAAAAGGLELDGLARRLVPPARGAWYRAAEETGPGAPASRLGVALAAWALARAAPDPEYLVAAAGCVARLTHADPASRADACLVALIAQERAVSGATSALDAQLARARPLALRFGGGPPSGRVDSALSALARFPLDPAAAGDECARLGGDASTAAALAGLGQEVAEARAGAWRASLAATSDARLLS